MAPEIGDSAPSIEEPRSPEPPPSPTAAPSALLDSSSSTSPRKPKRRKPQLAPVKRRWKSIARFSAVVVAGTLAVAMLYRGATWFLEYVESHAKESRIPASVRGPRPRTQSSRLDVSR